MPKITDPINIRGLELKNRLYAAPMISNLVREDCIASQKLIEATYYRARGGWGLYSTEGAIPSWNAKLFPRMLGVFDDNQVIGLYELVEAIHAGGAKAMCQVTHPGRQANPEALPNHVKKECLAPSDTTPPTPFPPSIPPRGMTEEDIRRTIADHVAVITRVQAAGFDMFELHCSHGTLPQQFLSPYTNHRSDQYGGSWENRLRFVRELLQAMRQAVGNQFPIACRVAADEFMEGGYALDDFCKYVAPAMEEAGCDLFDVTCGLFEHFTTITPELYEPRGVWIDLAASVKKVVGVPVVGLGRINDGRLAVKYIEDGLIDIVGIGRGSIADPYFAKKTIEGRYEDIRQCIACNTCLEDDFSNRPSRCAVNFEYQRNMEWWEERTPAARKARKIMVVGGGPAGLEFARVAHLRGHEVTVYEKSAQVGGYLPLASSYPRLYTRELMNIIRWLKREIDRAGIRVETGTTVTPELVETTKPDAVVLATGSTETRPEIPGLEDERVMTLDQFLSGAKTVGKRVVVIGGHYGSEAAVTLSREGKAKPEGYTKYHKPPEERMLAVTDPDKAKEVHLLEEGETVGFPPYSIMTRFMVINEFLAEGGVNVMVGTRVRDVSGGRVQYVDAQGNEGTIEADSVILALPRQADRDLFHQLAGKGIELWEIGDATGPEKVERAIHTANYTARMI
ncbi:MAG: FAD-dependent oxidoreductase [Proteobacteria bacterium]|nr:FAD-dependent oxidoreductase [Pseudomonadota bacterium]